MCRKLWGDDIINSLIWIFIRTGQELFSEKCEISKCHNFLISYPIFIMFAPICREIFTLSFEIMVILDWTSPLSTCPFRQVNYQSIDGTSRKLYLPCCPKKQKCECSLERQHKQEWKLKGLTSGFGQAFSLIFQNTCQYKKNCSNFHPHQNNENKFLCWHTCTCTWKMICYLLFVLFRQIA